VCAYKQKALKMKSEIFLNFIKSVVVKNGEQINPEIYLAVERDPVNLYEIRTDRFKSNSVTLKFFCCLRKSLNIVRRHGINI
jgi:hypothetical protein